MNGGELLRSARRRHNLSQAALARRCRTSQTYISRVERGEVSPTVAGLDRLLQALGERLELSARQLQGNRADPDVSADAGLSAAERIEEAAQLSEALTTLAGARAG